MAVVTATSLQAQEIKPKDLHQPVVQSIKTAAHRHGVDFNYLLEQAKAESSLNPNAKAKTSSATGLFQFIKSTWLNVIHKYGEENGYGEYANAIERDFQGRLYVADPKMEKEILDLRTDPQASSTFAAELALENQNYLKRKYDGEIGHTELYFAHFMGARGASNFLNAYQANPQNDAAELFPRAAKANKNVFFNKDGSQKSLSEVYAFFDNKFSKTSNANETNTAVEPQQVVTQTSSRKTHEPYTLAKIKLPDHISQDIRAFVENPGFHQLKMLSKLLESETMTSKIGQSLIQNLDVTLFGRRAF